MTCWRARAGSTYSVRVCHDSPFGKAKPLGRGTIVTEALSWMHPPVERAVETPRKVAKLRCSFCQAELGDDVELTMAGKDGHGKSTGSFCSAHCRNCVLALAALHPSPLAPDEFISRRGVLTDRLLDLWRHGRGPDPTLVLRAAERASCGLPNADSVVPTEELSKVVFLRPAVQATTPRGPHARHRRVSRSHPTPGALVRPVPRTRDAP
jgi:hypothetical protein